MAFIFSKDDAHQKGTSGYSAVVISLLTVLLQVIIVGAGPSGLILGLLLAKQGIEVELLDAGADLNKQPRAAHYATPAAYELARAGVLDYVRAVGIQCKSFAWRKMDTTFIAGMKHDVLPADYPYSMVVLPLDRLGEILYEHLQRQPTATVKWSHRVVRVGKDKEKAWVDMETSSGTTRSEADYVIGCDGASSTVRRELFGPEYPGETLDAQIIATNVGNNELYWMWHSKLIIFINRCTTTSANMATGTATSSSIRKTGTWQRASPQTDYIEYPTARCLGLRKKNTLHASHDAMRKFYPEIPNRVTIPLRT